MLKIAESETPDTVFANVFYENGVTLRPALCGARGAKHRAPNFARRAGKTFPAVLSPFMPESANPLARHGPRERRGAAGGGRRRAGGKAAQSGGRRRRAVRPADR